MVRLEAINLPPLLSSKYNFRVPFLSPTFIFGQEIFFPYRSISENSFFLPISVFLHHWTVTIVTDIHPKSCKTHTKHQSYVRE